MCTSHKLLCIGKYLLVQKIIYVKNQLNENILQYKQAKVMIDKTKTVHILNAA
jgi:hypothetical protein